jgi:hypothetical protein
MSKYRSGNAKALQKHDNPNLVAQNGDNRFERYFESRSLALYLIRLSMKKFFTIAVAFLPLCNLIAQTFLNQNFGSSKTQVHEFLKTKNLSGTSEPDENVLKAAAEHYTVTYYFDEGGLYKIETVSDFASRKEATVVLDDYRARLNNLTAEIIDLSQDKELTRFAALYERELHEVSAFALGKNGFHVTMIALDLDRAPGTAMNELRQDDMLFSMIH